MPRNCAALADDLEASGQLTDPTWRKVFETVPRHPYVPEFWTLTGQGQRRVTSADPGWLDVVCTDDALATQLTDGVATSSSTAPGLILTMLQTLDVADGHRVLEIAPDTASAAERGDDGRTTAVELWIADGSWARAEDGAVRQAGARMLWDAVEAAHKLYLKHERPGRERFGVTVTAEGQRIWLDTPSHPVPQVPVAG